MKATFSVEGVPVFNGHRFHVDDLQAAVNVNFGGETLRADPVKITMNVTIEKPATPAEINAALHSIMDSAESVWPSQILMTHEAYERERMSESEWAEQYQQIPIRHE